MSVHIDTKVTGVPDVDLGHARELLDKALKDQGRAERDITNGPLYLVEVRWELVRLARRMLGEQS